jgi:transcriptional antiterminator RfaH
MNWYLVQTKPRQEFIALEHLQRQTYECYFPILQVEQVVKGQVTQVRKPLFPRYLFIRLGQDMQSKSWGPIRSTVGVQKLVSFGLEPAKVASELIETIRSHELQFKAMPRKLFEPGQRVVLTQGPFAGIEGVFQMTDGNQRVMVLIEMMRKPVAVTAAPHQVKALD